MWSVGWAVGAYFLGSAAASAASVVAVIGMAATALLALGLTVAMKRSMRCLRQRAGEAYSDTPGAPAEVSPGREPTGVCDRLTGPPLLR